MNKILVYDSKEYFFTIFSKSFSTFLQIINIDNNKLVSISSDQIIVFVVYDYEDLFEYLKLTLKYSVVDLVVASAEMAYVLKKNKSIKFFTIDQYLIILKKQLYK